MKRIALLFLLVLACYSGINASLAKIHNEPDSAYLFSYATSKNNHRDGLHFAWSVDGENWHSIGAGYSFLKSDFGTWGGQKRMLQPVLIQDKNGMWHCLFTPNEVDNVLAHAPSADLVNWRPQSYREKGNDENSRSYKTALATNYRYALISGEEQSGMVHKVAWTLIDGLIKASELAAWKQTLYRETAATDSVRFAGLKPVDATITIDPSRSKPISDMLIGIFFEDINYAADGGIYAELVQNRGFEYSLEDKKGSDPTWNNTKAWSLKGDKATFSIAIEGPIHANNPHYAVIKLDQPGAALVNEGFNGIPLKGGEKYYFSLFSRIADGKGGKLIVRLVDESGETCAEASLNTSASAWKKQEVVLTAAKTVDNAQLQIVPQFSGSIAMDMISLFPQKTFKNRRNGMRQDLAQTLADMKPRFIRFPGGCVAHGDGLENMYRWKNTIGPLESRKPQRNIWNYHQTAGLGYFEYFQFCEDVGAEPLPVLPAGVPCQNSSTGGHGQQCGIPMEQMQDYVQEVLDLIEWANGDAKTTVWGKKRAEAGHPKPFNLKYIGVGNEDLISDVFEERYVMICNAIREKYPEMIVIGTVGPFYEGSDYREGWRIATEQKLAMVDEHYYNPPGWYIHNQDYYDRYDRNKSKVYLGEYAAHVAGRHNNIETALAEALHLANVERNGDIVSLTSYAPLLAKEGFTQWNPDLIYFNNTEVKPTVGYYVQKLYGQNSGDSYLPSLVRLSNERNAVQKRVAASVVHDSHSGDYIVKLVNILPVAVNAKMDLRPFLVGAADAELTILSGKPDDRTAKPVTTTVQAGEEYALELPAYSFTVLRIKGSGKAVKKTPEQAFAAYLFTYFTSNSGVGEAVRYALSEDGYNYKALNNNEPVLDSKAISSTGGVRDPHILRCQDGKTFYMVLTDMVSANGWDSNRAMVLLKSTDLVNWTSNVVNIQQKYAGQEDLKRVWAPQTVYDAEAGKYMVYWSMKHGNGPDIIYYAYANKDFTDIEGEPKQLFFPANGKSCIDGDIILKDGVYYMFYKTEGHGDGIKLATTKSLASGKWTEYPDYKQQTAEAVEGSSVFKLIGSDTYILMYDVYKKGSYQFCETTDLKNFKVIDSEVTMDFHPRHGTIIPITKLEFDRLTVKWGTR